MPGELPQASNRHRSLRRPGRGRRVRILAPVPGVELGEVRAFRILARGVIELVVDEALAIARGHCVVEHLPRGST